MINSFTASPTSGTAPLNVRFDWNVSDPDGDTLTCYLDKDNNGTADYILNNCSTSNVSLSYNSPGTYTAKLTADDGITKVSETITINVNASGGGGSGGGSGGSGGSGGGSGSGSGVSTSSGGGGGCNTGSSSLLLSLLVFAIPFFRRLRG